MAQQTNWSAALLDPRSNYTVLVPSERGVEANQGGEGFPAGAAAAAGDARKCSCFDGSARLPLNPSALCCLLLPTAARAANSTNAWVDPSLLPSGVTPLEAAPPAVESAGAAPGDAPPVRGLPPGLSMESWNSLGGYHFIPVRFFSCGLSRMVFHLLFAARRWRSPTPAPTLARPLPFLPGRHVGCPAGGAQRQPARDGLCGPLPASERAGTSRARRPPGKWERATMPCSQPASTPSPDLPSPSPSCARSACSASSSSLKTARRPT